MNGMNSLVDLLQKTTKAAMDQGKKLISGDDHDDDDHKDKFTQAEYVTVSDEAGGMWFLALFVFLLRLLLLVILGPFLYNMSMVKTFGVKPITGQQAVAMSFFIDLIL